MGLDTTELLAAAATIYGAGGAMSILLQAKQMLARGASCDVSVRFLAAYVGGYLVWLLYGLSLESLPMIVVHSIGLACGSVTLAIALQLRGSLTSRTTWAEC
jgi:uncharacterized protein with PQ loop repeat